MPTNTFSVTKLHTYLQTKSTGITPNFTCDLTIEQHYLPSFLPFPACRKFWTCTSAVLNHQGKGKEHPNKLRLTAPVFQAYIDQYHKRKCYIRKVFFTPVPTFSYNPALLRQVAGSCLSTGENFFQDQTSLRQVYSNSKLQFMTKYRAILTLLNQNFLLITFKCIPIFIFNHRIIVQRTITIVLITSIVMLCIFYVHIYLRYG